MTDRQALRFAPARRTANLRRDNLAALLLGLGSFALYAFTAAPSVVTLFDDSLEFQVVLPTLGIAHPSGYPLYTLLGKLFTLLIPFRDPAGRANLLSAVCAGAAIGMLYLLTRKFIGNRAAAIVTTVIFAISPGWWSQATIAEVYALHGLLSITFLYLLLRWEEATAGRGCADNSAAGRRLPTSGDGYLAAAAFVCGLGMTHHRTIALLLPAALIFIFWTDPGLFRRPRRWITPLILGLAPLLFYLYLPIRGQQVSSLDGTYVPTLAGTLDWIMARSYGVFLTGNPFGVQRDVSTIIALFLAQLGALTIMAAITGLVSAWRFSRRRYVFLLTATITQVAFASAYKVEDVIVFFLPALMFACVWAAWGLAQLLDAITQQAVHVGRPLRLPGWARPIYLAAWLLPAACIILFEPARDAVRTFAQRDRSAAWEVYDNGQDMVASAATGGEVVGLLGETTLVRYFRDVLGQRPDLRVTPADAERTRYAAIDAALAAGRPVYLTRDLPGAAARYSLDAAGPLIAVAPKAAPAPPPPGQPVAAGTGIVLADAVTDVRPLHAGPSVRVTLTWAATEPIREDLKVSARLIDGAGKVIAQNDGVPVHFTYPTTAWAPGERVVDAYDLALPPDAPEGTYDILLILYRAADGSEVGRVQLPAVTVQR